MGSPAVQARPLRTLRLLQASCGLLALASLVALGRPSSVIAAHDGAATVAHAHPAVPTEWAGVGQLAIPTIGVVPPGTEDWFDPQADPVLSSPPGSPLDVQVPSASLVPSPTAQRSDTAAAEQLPLTTAPTTTAPTTTAPETTGPETTGPETTAPETTAPESSAEPPPTPPAQATNERGNVPLAVGEELTVFDSTTGAAAFSIAVDTVVEATCTDPESTPTPNGRLIALLVRVTTGPDLSAVGDEPEVRAKNFRFLARDGTTLDEARSRSSDRCLPDTEDFPNGRVAPDQELTGTVVLDVPAAAGTLVFAPGFLPVGAEWELGPSR